MGLFNSLFGGEDGSESEPTDGDGEGESDGEVQDSGAERQTAADQESGSEESMFFDEEDAESDGSNHEPAEKSGEPESDDDTGESGTDGEESPGVELLDGPSAATGDSDGAEPSTEDGTDDGETTGGSEHGATGSEGGDDEDDGGTGLQMSKPVFTVEEDDEDGESSTGESRDAEDSGGRDHDDQAATEELRKEVKEASALAREASETAEAADWHASRATESVDSMNDTVEEVRAGLVTVLAALDIDQGDEASPDDVEVAIQALIDEHLEESSLADLQESVAEMQDALGETTDLDESLGTLVDNHESALTAIGGEVLEALSEAEPERVNALLEADSPEEVWTDFGIDLEDLSVGDLDDAASLDDVRAVQDRLARIEQAVGDEKRWSVYLAMAEERGGDALLASFPRTVPAQLLALDWLSSLAAIDGVGGALEALMHYEDVGWLSPAARDQLLILLGLVDSEAASKASAPASEMTEFHETSHDYIQALSEMHRQPEAEPEADPVGEESAEPNGPDNDDRNEPSHSMDELVSGNVEMGDSPLDGSDSPADSDESADERTGEDDRGQDGDGGRPARATVDAADSGNGGDSE